MPDAPRPHRSFIVARKGAACLASGGDAGTGFAKHSAPPFRGLNRRPKSMIFGQLPSSAAIDRSATQIDDGLTREMQMISAAFAPPKAPVSIPVREILPWAVFGGLLCLLALYFVGAEQGATSIFPGMYIHEFVHDGRHLLGFPCH